VVRRCRRHERNEDYKSDFWRSDTCDRTDGPVAAVTTSRCHLVIVDDGQGAPNVTERRDMAKASLEELMSRG